MTIKVFLTTLLSFFLFLTFLLFSPSLLLAAPPCCSGSPVFGPVVYQRDTAKPVVVDKNFSVTNAGSYTLCIINGDAAGNNRISSAVISINGIEVASPNEFNQQIGSITKTVTLNKDNLISVEIRSSPGSYITVTILGPPKINITSPANGSTITDPSVTIVGTIDDNSAQITVNGISAAVSNSTFSANISLVEGQNSIEIIATNQCGLKAIQTILVTVSAKTPTVQICIRRDYREDRLENNALFASLFDNLTLTDIRSSERVLLAEVDSLICDDAFVNYASIYFHGQSDDPQAIITVNGKNYPNNNGYFEGYLYLVEGRNIITASAKNNSGKIGTDTITIILDTIPPAIAITSPKQGDIINQPTVTVTGTISDANAITWATINNIATAIDSSGNFTLPNVPLSLEGTNTISVSAGDVAGNSGYASISVTRETGPPKIEITSPSNNAYIGPTGFVENAFPPIPYANIPISGTIDDPTATITSNCVGICSGATIASNRFTISNYQILNNGAHTITVTATDPFNNTAQDSIQVILDGEAPRLISTTPSDNSTIYTSTITITGTFEDLSPVTVTVNGVNATVTNNTFTSQPINLAEGLNNIAIQLKDIIGNSGDAILNITYSTSATAGAIMGIVVDSATDQPINGAVVSITDADKTQTATTAPDGSFTIRGITPGNITGTATKTGYNTGIFTEVINAGEILSVKIPINSSIPTGLSIQITSPSTSSTIYNDRTTVSGVVNANTADIGVTVNGKPAAIVANQFTINNIPIIQGLNTITAILTDVTGNTASTSITVYGQPSQQPIRLTATPESGITPLNTKLTVDSSLSTITQYRIDYAGPAVIEVNQISSTEFELKITTEGIYHITYVATDSLGRQYTDTIAIAVLSKTEIDNLLKAKWEGLKLELKAKDIGKALSYFDIESRDRYSAIFTALIGEMPAILDTFVEFNFVKLYGYIIEYEVVANENGVLYSYPITFVKGKDGIWRFKDF